MVRCDHQKQPNTSSRTAEGDAMKAKSIQEAWSIANEIFKTDYMKDDKASQNAGYPVYWSTAEGVNAWISDLGDRLEVNQDGKSINIWIEEEPETEPAAIETEKTFSVNYEEIATRKRETVTTKEEARITLGVKTRMSDITGFFEDVKRIHGKALKAVKAGNTFSLIISEAGYKWTGRGGDEMPKLETVSFNSWEAAPVWEQDTESDYIYLRPDTKYTEEHRAMVLRKGHLFEDLAEYIG